MWKHKKFKNSPSVLNERFHINAVCVKLEVYVFGGWDVKKSNKVSWKMFFVTICYFCHEAIEIPYNFCVDTFKND